MQRTTDFEAPISLREPALRLVEKIRRVLGNSICRFLEEPGIVEIMLNTDGTLWIERLSVGMECIGTMSSSQAESVICSVAAYHKEIVTRENPIFEGELPLNGERFEALIPPVVSAPVFTIRLKASKIFTLAEYVSDRIMTEHQKEMIESAVLHRQNILVVGGTGTGKTTLTNAIIEAIERLAPDHRLIIIEDTAEIQCSAKNVNLLHATDTVDMLRLLKATMRLRPDRILVGEVRGPEALALLKAWNTGHPGGAATVHANSARAGLIRLEQLIAETSANPMQRLIAEAVNVIVSIIKTPEGRKIDEILTVRGFQDGDYVLI
jgi:P-type conjugative transfer ATPase TrbB